MKKVVILDFGSQYTQLIARRVREINVFCEIFPYNKFVPSNDIGAVILSGSPFSVQDENALQIDLDPIIGHYPVLAICYGAQYIAQKNGGKVARSTHREYGKSLLSAVVDHPIFEGVSMPTQVWMSHGDTIVELPSNCNLIASTGDIDVAAYSSQTEENPYVGLQFHPEVTHSLDGKKIISNFLFKIAGLEENWSPHAFVETSTAELKTQLGDDKVVLGLSGGVDSSVAGMLLHRAIGDHLTCIFVNNGLLRLNEYEEVLEAYQGLGLQVIGVDASDRFLSELSGVSDPEKKRKIIGRVFIEVFQEEAEKIKDVKWLAQGTIYPDVIESVSVHGPSVTIKSHHNVGGLPDLLHLKLVEPLRMLFKDEVRRIGAEVGLPSEILNRHPFPGPGLAIRILGDITAEKVRILQEADHIYIQTLLNSGWYDKIWQAGTILLPIQSVGVMGDERTYERVIALRAVTSMDGMTAEWSRIDYNILAEISSKIINRVKGVNRVVYDISTKPPATIEWE